ncbi:uncharacterized protein K460DRAFT_362954 [Cucurbitaria berberidis CBS 394.84]|uniref:Uncharacterized protein n=1 Tax=Cucurbitaria berberidis CBS 394.84 TaxID=1168544 RepID=A0A9P4LEM2_9PLEO|nr:uncharacterized protein K460DRAFT_362954 [Cucurbitaria berberidis CBS 394.84]KAF1852185.1 hypothetical protein K460DRAFT_362954 [Cucurbitaria berberidis CBS 394.84]
MWQLGKHDSAMDAPRIARPWTPPETDAESSPRSDYFSDSFRGPDSAYSSFTEHRWPPNRLDELANTSSRCDTPTDDHLSRPKPIATHTLPLPYTPTKTFGLDNEQAHGAPVYPYTPDSSRILRRNTEVQSSPTPWDDYPEDSPSPVQDALSSCIAQFENLIQTRQPDDDQMEYIVGQFEAIASYLSAPESQTRKTDEQLSAEQEGSTGLGITSSTEATRDSQTSVQVNEEYVAEVGRYIAGVKTYIEDLKMRLDEVKTLNSIQLEVIDDLRRQMKTVRQEMRTSLDMRKDLDQAEAELADIGDGQSNDELEGAAPGREQKEFGLESWETIANDDASSPRRCPPNGTDEISKSRREEKLSKTEDPCPPPPPRRKVRRILRRPQQQSFWQALAEALDAFGGLFFED